MANKKLLKGNEAVVLGALAAGCDAYFGYPITPASEIAHTAALYFPRLGRTFLQAESELAAINMVFGAAAAGMRAMTASSSPGISLKMEGLSYIACAEMPCVIVDVMRAGPGLGNIGPEQADYFQITRGGGHGDYRVIVLAPSSAQEMYDFAIRAFELADRYRTPVVILTDAVIGQMMEAVRLHTPQVDHAPKPWRLDETAATNRNLVTTIYLDFGEMEAHVRRLMKKYAQIAAEVAEAEVDCPGNPDLVVTGYGIVSRILYSLVQDYRARGLNLGYIRPVTLWPFPADAFAEAVPSDVPVLVVELSSGQMVEDVRLALPDRTVFHYGRHGGNLPTLEELTAQIDQILHAGG